MDNGPEFMGGVAELIRQINPLSTLVHGRCRHPQDQGSVENVNKGINNVITKMVLEKQACFETDEEQRKVTWVTVLGYAMRNANTMLNKGNGGITPYEIVFGQTFDEQLMQQLDMSLLTNLQLHCTLENCLPHLTNDFQKKGPNE